jgi:hypothetical protein
METVGSAYLYTLAQISITFAGFTVLFIVLRQAIGSVGTKYDVFGIRNYFFLSFLVISGAMLPSLLAAFMLQQLLIWRIASVAVAVPLFGFLVSFPFRRRGLTGVRLPISMWPQQIIFTVAVTTLLANAFGFLGGPNVALYELGVTLIQLDLFYAILLTLGMVFGIQPLGISVPPHKTETPT